MNANLSYAVFGLGKYGRAVAKELVQNGKEVLAVDINEDIVNAASTEIPYCKCADVTDSEVIKQLGIANVDVVIISMATNLEASVMATVLCKEAGVKTVIVKCASEMNCKILSKIGAARIDYNMQWDYHEAPRLGLRNPWLHKSNKLLNPEAITTKIAGTEVLAFKIIYKETNDEEMRLWKEERDKYIELRNGFICEKIFEEFGYEAFVEECYFQNREDLLDFGSGKRIKKIKVGRWDLSKHSLDNHSVVPKL